MSEYSTKVIRCRKCLGKGEFQTMRALMGPNDTSNPIATIKCSGCDGSGKQLEVIHTYYTPFDPKEPTK